MGIRKILSPFVPVILAGVGLLPFMGLRSPVDAWPTGTTHYFLEFAGVSIIWLVFEVVFVMRRDTNINDLALDCLLQTCVAIAFAAVGGYLAAGGNFFGRNALEWWFAIPMFVAILDAVLSNGFVVKAAQSITEDAKTGRYSLKETSVASPHKGSA